MGANPPPILHMAPQRRLGFARSAVFLNDTSCPEFSRYPVVKSSFVAPSCVR
ncbi:MAG: hypothetical protein ACI9KE_005825 [Polyangiales bacterium]|jgi:hypothetical protein